MNIADELARISRLGRRGIPLTERDFEVIEIAAAALRLHAEPSRYSLPAPVVNLSGLIAALDETWKRGQPL